MLNVLNTQLYRLKKSKLFWAMLIVCAVLPIIGMIFTTALIEIVSHLLEGMEMDILGELRTDGGEMTLQALGGLFNLGSDAALFSAICSSIFLSGEFSGGAIRNMVLANKSRTQIFLSFLSIALIIGFSYLGVAYLSTLVCYGAVMGFSGVTVSNVISGCFTSLFLALLSIALVQSCVVLFLFSTRKTGATVAFPLLILIIAPSIITSIVDLVLGLRMLAGSSVSEAAMSWIPIYNMSLFNAAEIDGALVGKIALYNIPLAAIFAFFGWFAISRVDLK